MKIHLCTLCLNEMEWLPKLYEQHKDFPNLVKWVFVEAADRIYAAANPSMVSSTGLSVDGTGDYLQRLADKDSRVIRIAHGFCGNPDKPEQGKCEARQRYLDVAEAENPDWLITLDADEFVTKDGQESMGRIMSKVAGRYGSLCFKFRHIWHPPSVQENHPQSQFFLEVKGGMWDIHHARAFRWKPDMKYTSNHNIPNGAGRICRYDTSPSNPEIIHMAYAARLKERQAKAKYYLARGEGVSDQRGLYVVCRAAYEAWYPGMRMPQGTEVVPYMGKIPECFKEGL